jgi:hypothetical protein
VTLVEINAVQPKVYVFRQSQLNTLLTCLEQGRLDMVDPQEQETDATAIGTAFHTGVEHILRGGTDLLEAIDVAWAKYAELAAQPFFRAVQVKTAPTAQKYIGLAMAGWWETIRPLLGEPMMIEDSFKLLAAERPGVEVWLSGTIDFVDADGIWDWKTAGDEKKYKDGYGGEGWKLKRFAVQPTVYTWAVHELTGRTLPFTFAAATKGTTSVQTVKCERGPADWGWMIEQLWGLVDFFESMGTDNPWPKNDQHALCSEKWCAFWARCKGRHYN